MSKIFRYKLWQGLINRRVFISVITRGGWGERPRRSIRKRAHRQGHAITSEGRCTWLLSGTAMAQLPLDFFELVADV